MSEEMSDFEPFDSPARKSVADTDALSGGSGGQGGSGGHGEPMASRTETGGSDPGVASDSGEEVRDSVRTSGSPLAPDDQPGEQDGRRLPAAATAEQDGRRLPAAVTAEQDGRRVPAAAAGEQDGRRVPASAAGVGDVRRRKLWKNGTQSRRKKVRSISADGLVVRGGSVVAESDGARRPMGSFASMKARPGQLQALRRQLREGSIFTGSLPHLDRAAEDGGGEEEEEEDDGEEYVDPSEISAVIFQKPSRRLSQRLLLRVDTISSPPTYLEIITPHSEMGALREKGDWLGSTLSCNDDTSSVDWDVKSRDDEWVGPDGYATIPSHGARKSRERKVGVARKKSNSAEDIYESIDDMRLPLFHSRVNCDEAETSPIHTRRVLPLAQRSNVGSISRRLKFMKGVDGYESLDTPMTSTSTLLHEAPPIPPWPQRRPTLPPPRKTSAPPPTQPPGAQPHPHVNHTLSVPVSEWAIQHTSVQNPLPNTASIITGHYHRALYYGVPLVLVLHGTSYYTLDCYAVTMVTYCLENTPGCLW